MTQSLSDIIRKFSSQEARDFAVLFEVENNADARQVYLEAAVGAYRRREEVAKSIEFAMDKLGYEFALQSCVDAKDFSNAMKLARDFGDFRAASDYAVRAARFDKAAKYAHKAEDIVRARALYEIVITVNDAAAREELVSGYEECEYDAGNHFYQAGVAADARHEAERANVFFEKAKVAYLLAKTIEGENAAIDMESIISNPARKKHYEFASSDGTVIDPT